MEQEQEPASVEAFGAAYQRARRRRLLIALGVLVLAVAGVGAYVVRARAAAKDKAQLAYAELTQCLFGAAPPAQEDAALAFRAGQLAAMGLEEIHRAPVDKVPWPKRCGYRSQDLLEAAKSAGFSSREQKDLPYWADQLAAALKSPQGHALDVSEPLLKVLEEAEKHGLVGQEGREPGPPPKTTPLTIDELAKGAPLAKKAFPLRGMTLDAYPGPRRRALVTDRSLPESPMVCAFDGASLGCASLPEPLPSLGHALSLLGTASSKAPFALIAAGDYGEQGVYRSDTGQKLYAAYSYGAHVFDDGTVAALIENKKGKRPFLLWAPVGKPTQQAELETKLEVGSFAYNGALLWGQVILRGFDPDEKATEKTDDGEEVPVNRGVKLQTLALDEKTLSVGKPVAAGQLGTFFGGGLGAGNDDPDLWGCHDGNRMTLLIDQGPESFALVHASDAWSAPLRIPRFVRTKVLCDQASTSWSSQVFGRAEEPWEVTVRHQRCASTECKALRGSLKDLLVGGLELAPRDKMVDALSFGEHVLWAWVAGERGGVRVRIGPADKLKDAADLVVFDDLAEGGRVREKSIVSELRLFGAPASGGQGPSAVLLLGTERGTFAIRITADGKFSPLPVTAPFP